MPSSGMLSRAICRRHVDGAERQNQCITNISMQASLTELQHAKCPGKDGQSKPLDTDSTAAKAGKDASKPARTSVKGSEKAAETLSKSASVRAPESDKAHSKTGAKDTGTDKVRSAAAVKQTHTSTTAPSKDSKAVKQPPAKHSPPQKAAADKGSRKRSRSRSRSRSPSKRNGTVPHLNGRDSRKRVASPEDRKQSRHSLQQERESRKVWMYSDNSKTHGPWSLVQLRDVLKNLEQDRHRHKVYIAWRHSTAKLPLLPPSKCTFAFVL